LNAIGATPPLISASDFYNGGMKGFVIGFPRKLDADYFDALAATGARVGRIFLPFRKFKHDDKYVLPFVELEALKRVLGLASDRGIRLVVVGGFAEPQGALWANTSLQNSFVESWRQFARSLGNHPAIAGLDLLNEPNPPRPNDTLAEAHLQWKPLAQKAIEAIRSEGVKIPIIYEGVLGGSTYGLGEFEPLKDTNVVYSIHQYEPHDITHQRVNNNWTRTIPYPCGAEYKLGAWDTKFGIGPMNLERLFNGLRDTREFQRKYNVPIFVGEFSCVRWAPKGSREAYITDCLKIFEQYGWSWTFHEFRGWGGWDAEISSEDPRITDRSSDSPAMKLLLSALRRPQ
jgi:hypothetical protein